MTISLNIPIACTLNGEELAARRQRIFDGLFIKSKGQRELEDGYAFQFPNSDAVAQELLDFVLLERQCCAFFQIELAFSPEKGPIWLHLRGGDGVKRFIETELRVSNEF